MHSNSKGDTWRTTSVEADGAIEIVVAGLAVDADAVRASASLLSPAERKRACRFASSTAARRYIVSRARLREVLGARLGVRPESVELVYGAGGKPALANAGWTRVRFNLSHCDDLAVYALSASGCEVGIDVEAIRPLPEADVLAARFFSRREHAAYRALRRRDRPLGFFQCWTRKEAFVKALGEGLSHPLDSFDVSLAPGAPAELLHVDPGPGVDRNWRLASFSPAPGFVAAVAAEAC